MMFYVSLFVAAATSLLLKCSWATVDSILTDKKFYIYDWPDLINRYANQTDRGHHMHTHGVDIPDWLENNGIGKPTNYLQMEYKTSQYSMAKIYYERALLDSRRTLDPDEATTFFIPFDLGMHAMFTEKAGRMLRTACPLGDTVIKRLEESPYFKKKLGHDHLLIMSINQNLQHYLGPLRCTNLLKLCWNCTKLSPDEYLFTARDREFEMSWRGANWHAVPYPADYHYSEIANPLLEGHHALPPWQRLEEKRSIIVSFLGSVKRYDESSTKVRETLVNQCEKWSDKCIHGKSYRIDSTGSLHNLARKSVFCLQPPGDHPTRKSLFDAILSGCIPVLFHPLTAKYMYEWHWGQDVWNRTAISFDTTNDIEAVLHEELDVVKALITMYETDRDEVTKRQKLIAELAYELQYTAIDKKMGFTAVPKRSPEGNYDAYDISINNVLSIHAGLMNHTRKSDYVICNTIVGRNGVKLQTTAGCKSTENVTDPYTPSTFTTLIL